MTTVEDEGSLEVDDTTDCTKEVDIPNYLLVDKHLKYFQQMLGLVPEMYQSIDSSRLTVLYFSLSALDLLGKIEKISDNRKQEIIRWIYSLQNRPCDDDYARCGFIATDSLPSDVDANYGHIAMTYVALCSLLILGDDLSRVDRDSVINGLKCLQLKTGAYQCIALGSESDARFVYCAACISSILQDWRGMDKDRATEFLMDSQSYEGGFAQNVGREAHGGSTFCSIAALTLMNKLDDLPRQRRNDLLRWCLQRQQTGFNGRPNKPMDTCYSFWLGASLKLLGAQDFVNQDANFSFLMTTQDRYIGGFSKWAGYMPDVLHSYFGIAGMHVISNEVEIHPALNISMRAFRHWQDNIATTAV